MKLSSVSETDRHLRDFDRNLRRVQNTLDLIEVKNTNMNTNIKQT